MKMKICSFVMILTIMMNMFVFNSEAGSRGSSSGSSSSSRSSSSSFSRPSAPASRPSTTFSQPSPPKASPSYVKPASPTTFSKPSNTATVPVVSKNVAQPQRTPAQQAVFTKAKENGTLYTNKSQAVNDFKSKHASTYASTYKSEPSARPTHIPHTTTINNKNYNVVYNQSHGGYGYWSGGGPGLGTWMMYDMMSDAVMMSAMMNRHNYVVHSSPPDSVTTHSDGSITRTTYRDSSYLYFNIFLGFIAILFVVVLSIGLYNENR